MGMALLAASQAGRPPSAGGSGSAPDWVATAIANGWLAGEWLAVSGASPTSGYGLAATNTLLDVNTAGDSSSALNEGFIDSWTGAALCSGHRSYGTMMFGPGGSHNQYGKGTVYLFDLETRTWEEVAGQDSSGFNATYGEYNSGRPITNHCAWWPFYDSYRNEFCYPKGWGDPTSGSDQYPVAFGHGLDLSAYDADGYADSQWRRYPELTGLTGVGGAAPSLQMKGLAQQCGGVWDASRNVFWFASAFNSTSSSGIVAKYDSVANTWVQYAQQWCIFLGSAYAIDPTRDCMVIATPNNGGSIMCLDLANPDTRYGSPTSTSALWTATEQGTPPADYSQWGWHWSAAKGGFIHYDWNTSTTQVKLASYVSGGTFSAGVQTDYTLSWSNLLAGTNAVTVSSPRSAGAYSKFQLAAWGDTEIAFFCPDVSGPMYAFRVN